MPKFTAKVLVMVPAYMEAAVTVKAQTKTEAESLIREMYNNDKLDFDSPASDYDSAKITSIEWS